LKFLSSMDGYETRKLSYFLSVVPDHLEDGPEIGIDVTLAADQGELGLLQGANVFMALGLV
jgi:hypothetical protein